MCVSVVLRMCRQKSRPSASGMSTSSSTRCAQWISESAAAPQPATRTSCARRRRPSARYRAVVASESTVRMCMTTSAVPDDRSCRRWWLYLLRPQAQQRAGSPNLGGQCCSAPAGGTACDMTRRRRCDRCRRSPERMTVGAYLTNYCSHTADRVGTRASSAITPTTSAGGRWAAISWERAAARLR